MVGGVIALERLKATAIKEYFNSQIEKYYIYIYMDNNNLSIRKFETKIESC